MSKANNAQAMGAAAALPSATKTEARTARPATEKKEGTMQTTEQQAQAAIKSDKEAQATPLNLHAIYRQNRACGFDVATELRHHEAEGLAGRLRAISALSAVLLTTSGPEVELGPYLQHGLVDAIRFLASDAMDDLEHANDRATNAALAEAAKHLEGGSHGL